MANTEVAVTVDDLPVHGDLPVGTSRLGVAKQMIEALKRHKIPGVYGFINAGRMHKSPVSLAVLKEWVSAGFPLGNHTFSHKRLSAVTADDFIEEIKKNEPMLSSLSPADFHWFRYPYLVEGDTEKKRDQIREFLFKSHYKIAQVTIDFEDWAWNDPYARCVDKGDKNAIEWLKRSYIESAVRQIGRTNELSNVLFSRDIKHILLLHIGAFDSMMLDDLLTAFEKSGVHFISLAEATNDSAYLIDPKVLTSHGRLFLDQLMEANKKVYPQSSNKLPLDRLEQICR